MSIVAKKIVRDNYKHLLIIIFSQKKKPKILIDECQIWQILIIDIVRAYTIGTIFKDFNIYIFLI